MQDLDRREFRTRRQVQSNASIRGGIRFGVGPLTYLLSNRFFIGEVVYRGAIHPGEQEAIVDGICSRPCKRNSSIERSLAR